MHLNIKRLRFGELALGNLLLDAFFSFLSFFFPIKFPGICTIYYVLSFSFRRQGQFNFAEVLIKPLDNASNMVTVRFKDELKELLADTGTRVISDNNLPRLVRQLVVHINVSIT